MNERTTFVAAVFALRRGYPRWGPDKLLLKVQEQAPRATIALVAAASLHVSLSEAKDYLPRSTGIPREKLARQAFVACEPPRPDTNAAPRNATASTTKLISGGGTW